MCNCSRVEAAFPLFPFLLGYGVLDTILVLFTKTSKPNKKEHYSEHCEVPQELSKLGTRRLTFASKLSSSTQILGIETDVDKASKEETGLCNRKRSKRNTAAFKVSHARDGFLCHFHLDLTLLIKTEGRSNLALQTLTYITLSR